jgi:hypothetical protein
MVVRKIKNEAKTLVKFFVFLPMIMFSMAKTMLRIRKDIGHQNPEMWEQ